ncbi:tetratricopeptide repeat protein [Sphingomonas sediminicola]|uniref:Tetratricopeptide repeat protein n=1 Tax=Sphingomonas sediminicola TaxID=386874 RepID=A0ABX6T4X4_9SPHN|nr:tetratricopeptide repeat protein [Sphingomonas sediminicola]QNP44931.1 tetratricopeptide repeat protein [Sphingomonas sediminicola]
MFSNPLSRDASAKSKVALDFASAALRSGNRLKAQMHLRDRLAEDPTDADALTVLAQISAEDRQIEDATVLLRRAVSADPRPERRLALIEHLLKHAGAALALREFEELPPNFRKKLEVSGMEAKTLGLLGMHDAQIDTYKRMLREQPNRAGTWMNLANALRTVGRIDEAVKALKRATKLQPTMGQAYWTLANFKSYRFSAPDIAQMQQALRQNVSLDEALHIHFALGKAYEDQGTTRLRSVIMPRAMRFAHGSWIPRRSRSQSRSRTRSRTALRKSSSVSRARGARRKILSSYSGCTARGRRSSSRSSPVIR